MPPVQRQKSFGRSFSPTEARGRVHPLAGHFIARDVADQTVDLADLYRSRPVHSTPSALQEVNVRRSIRSCPSLHAVTSRVRVAGSENFAAIWARSVGWLPLTVSKESPLLRESSR